jgi:hypothetical protein
MSAAQQPAHWTSAMTYKFVGTLRSLTDDKPYQRTAIYVGILIGFLVQGIRRLVKSNPGYQRFAGRSRVGFAIDFLFDAVVLPSPYAYSFGGFVNLITSTYIAAGGVLGSFMNSLPKPKAKPGQPELPDDMSTASLLGGGLIAGDALAALGLGIFGLLSTMAGS